MHKTNPESLSPCFRVFPLNFASDFFNLLLARFHQAQIIVVTTRLGWEWNHQPCDHGRRKNEAPNHSATLPTSGYLNVLR